MSDAFDTVTAGYNFIGSKYREWSRRSPVRLYWVDWLLKNLPLGSLVVDLGCGSGEPGTRMLAERHRVIGVDGSLVQLRLAERAAPSAHLIRADMTRFALRSSSVDAVASFYALGHVPAARHAALFSTIADWLQPGGLILTSAPLAAGDGTVADWLDVPMFFGGIGETATRRALQRCGLSIERWHVMEEDEGDGHLVRFLWLVARKPKSRIP
jgi:cyclopropane fatty-acyl-phospholipid synthase-like methyltransferase